MWRALQGCLLSPICSLFAVCVGSITEFSKVGKELFPGLLILEQSPVVSPEGGRDKGKIRWCSIKSMNMKEFEVNGSVQQTQDFDPGHRCSCPTGLQNSAYATYVTYHIIDLDVFQKSNVASANFILKFWLDVANVLFLNDHEALHIQNFWGYCILTKLFSLTGWEQ